MRLLRLRLDPYVSWLLLLGFPLFSSFGLRGSSFSSVLTSVVLDPAQPSSSCRGHAAAKGGRLRSQLHVDSRGKSSCLDFVCLFLSSVPVSFFMVVSSLIVTVSLFLFQDPSLSFNSRVSRQQLRARVKVEDTVSQVSGFLPSLRWSSVLLSFSSLVFLA